MENEMISAKSIDFKNLLDSAVSFYEESTGKTVSNETKALILDFGARSAMMVSGLALAKITSCWPIEKDFSPVFNEYYEDLLNPLMNSIVNASSDYPATWKKIKKEV